MSEQDVGTVGAARQEVTGGQREVRKEVLHDLYCPLNIVSVDIWRRYGWVGYVARMGDLEKNSNAYPQNA